MYIWKENGVLFLGEEAPNVDEFVFINDPVDLSLVKDIVNGEVVYKTEEERKSEYLNSLIEELTTKFKFYLNDLLSKYNYYSLGDLSLYVLSGDAEAKQLFNTYIKLDSNFYTVLDRLKSLSLSELQELNADSLLKEVINGN